VLDEKKSSVVLGRAYHSDKDSSGYIVIMKITKTHITYSHLFGWEDLSKTIQSSKINEFYKLYWNYSESTGIGCPIILARFDHELMRRRNKI